MSGPVPLKAMSTESQRDEKPTKVLSLAPEPTEHDLAPEREEQAVEPAELDQFAFEVLTKDEASAGRFNQLIVAFKAHRKAEKAKRVRKLLNKPIFTAYQDLTLSTAEGTQGVESGRDKKVELNTDDMKERGKAVLFKYPDIKKPEVSGDLRRFPAFVASYLFGAEDIGPRSRYIYEKSPTPGGKSTRVGALHLLTSREAFIPRKPLEEKARPGFSKRGHPDVPAPEYVADNSPKAIPTRRYAYFETSRQQLMAAIGTAKIGDLPPAFRGRFANQRSAMKVDPGIMRIDSADDKVAEAYGADMGPMSMDKMAHLHQYFGSGANQRGVSLTSTPKQEIYSNEGTTFRSHDGVRIKVDLSMVPPDIIMLNHYSPGGVADRLAKGNEVRPEFLEKPAGDGGYNYRRSVLKNREIFLEELRPQWIVEIDDHLKDPVGQRGVGPGAKPRTNSPNTLAAGPGGADVGEIRKLTGFQHYQLGRACGLKLLPANATDCSSEFEFKNYMLGYLAGKEERQGFEAGTTDYGLYWDGFKYGLDRSIAYLTKAQVKAPTGDQRSGIKIDILSSGANNAYNFIGDIKVATGRPERLELAKKVLAARSPLSVFNLVKQKNCYPEMHDTFWMGWAAGAGQRPRPVADILPVVAEVANVTGIPLPGAAVPKAGPPVNPQVQNNPAQAAAPAKGNRPDSPKNPQQADRTPAGAQPPDARVAPKHRRSKLGKPKDPS